MAEAGHFISGKLERVRSFIWNNSWIWTFILPYQFIPRSVKRESFGVGSYGKLKCCCDKYRGIVYHCCNGFRSFDRGFVSTSIQNPCDNKENQKSYRGYLDLRCVVFQFSNGCPFKCISSIVRPSSCVPSLNRVACSLLENISHASLP